MNCGAQRANPTGARPTRSAVALRMPLYPLYPLYPALPRSPPHPEFPRADSRPGAPPTTRDERSRTPDVRGARAEPASRSGTARPPARGLGAGEADC